MIDNKVKIIIKGKDRTDSISEWCEYGDKIRIAYLDGKVYFYNTSNVQIKRNILSDNNALNCFEYLKSVAKTVGLHDLNGGNILSKHYSKIDFVGEEDNMLASFLSSKLQDIEQATDFTAVYPFGFNISQKAAVDNALANPLTIIEGPPGTGKTQTILNIIANAVMRGESVAVVSSNNSATANVLEKLKKYNVDFIVAYLGNSENKQQFIESQKPLPNISDWELSLEQEGILTSSLQNLFVSLTKMLLNKNELSQLRQEFDKLEVEYKHFGEYCNFDNQYIAQYFEPITSDTAMELWLLCEKYIERGKMPGFFGRLFNRLRRGVINKAFYSLSPDVMIAICQKCYYMTRIAELTSAISKIQKELEDFDFNKKMNEYTTLSEKLFHNKLAKKYQDTERCPFEINDLWKNSEEFINEYPVILATTYSLRSSLSHRVMYDYVIIDEASQVDLATGALALSCAKKAIIVGDLKQLPNVVDSNMARNTDIIFQKSKLPEVYRYKNHSLLSTLSELFPNAPRTLLREHYRCHPKIIGFCNQKFYNNQLIILTESKSKRQPLIVYKTAPGNHAREHINQRQIDVIKNEIIPQCNLIDDVSIGIVTPYRNQTNALQQAFAETDIKADTVDKFQGRENDVIILSTVDNVISDFADNSNRLNVAVSRAIEQLIVVINGDDDARDTNTGDLIHYIQYNNFDIIQSEIHSVFDYLYKSYYEKRKKFLHKRKRVSEYDSENLMYVLISDLLESDEFMKFDVATHVPLKMIFRDTSALDENERRYAENILTHVDFLVFDKLGKTPRLAIEIDGMSFHAKGSQQAERDKIKDTVFEKYGLPLMRFKTNESDERTRLVSKLNEI